MEAREGKDVVTLEIDFGGRINRSWRRMECGYPGLGTGQIIRNLCDQIETRVGEAGKKKKDFLHFWISQQGGRVLLFPERMGMKLGEENSLLI